MSPQRFLIIGGGVVGASAAYRLSSTGHEVTVVDARRADAASPAAAGVISPGSVFAYGGTAPAGFAPLAVAASRHYAGLVASLRTDGYDDCGYSQPGALVVATNDDEVARLDGVLTCVEERRALGAANIGEPARLDADAARALHPLLGEETREVIHLPEVARVDGRKLVAALLGAAEKHGAEVVDDEVRLVARDGGVVVESTSGRAYEADRYIVAAGSWTPQVVAGLGIDLPVGAESGEMVYVRLPEAPTGVPLVMGFVHTRYTLPVGPQEFGLGATQRPPAEPIGVKAAGIAAILAETTRVSPAFGGAFIERLTVGNRPTTPDHLPILGELGDTGTVFVASGHGSYGLMQGPYSGALIADLAAGGEIDLDLAPYAPGRFAESGR